MEQARGLAGHGVFIVAKVRQGVGDEGLQTGQCLGTVQRPAHGVGLRLAKAVDAAALQHGPQCAVVVRGAPVLRLWRGAGPGLAVVMVKIPLTACGLIVLVQQQAVAAAHAAVEMLHQPLAAPVHLGGQIVPRRQKVFAVYRAAVQWGGAGPVLQLGIEPPFVGLLPLHRVGAVVRGQCSQVVGDGLAVAGVVKRHITHAVARSAQLVRQIAHGGKDGQNFLCVVQHVVGFLAHFHQHVDHLRIHLPEPAVLRVELVAQQQAQGVCAVRGGGGGCAGAGAGAGAGVAHAVPHSRW